MKSNLAQKPSFDAAVSQLAGTVIARSGADVTVRTDAGRVAARRARSCLVEPRVGDEVLLCTVGDAAYVLAVLDGQAEGPTTLEIEGDLAINLPDGQLSVAAQRGVSVVSAKDVAIASPEISVHAVAVSVVMDRLTWLASVVKGEVGRARLVAGTLERVAERITERAKRVYRRVEELDQLHAENIDWEAKKNLAVHCENALVTADKLVKFDADQIHMG